MPHRPAPVGPAKKTRTRVAATSNRTEIVQAAAAGEPRGARDEAAAAPAHEHKRPGRLTHAVVPPLVFEPVEYQPAQRVQRLRTQSTRLSATGLSKQGSRMKRPTKQCQASSLPFTNDDELQVPRRRPRTRTAAPPSALQALKRGVWVPAASGAVSWLRAKPCSCLWVWRATRRQRIGAASWRGAPEAPGRSPGARDSRLYAARAESITASRSPGHTDAAPLPGRGALQAATCSCSGQSRRRSPGPSGRSNRAQ